MPSEDFAEMFLPPHLSGVFRARERTVFLLDGPRCRRRSEASQRSHDSVQSTPIID